MLSSAGPGRVGPIILAIQDPEAREPHIQASLGYRVSSKSTWTTNIVKPYLRVGLSMYLSGNALA